MFTLSDGQDDLTLDAGLVGAAPGFGFAFNIQSSGNYWARDLAIDTAGNFRPPDMGLISSVFSRGFLKADRRRK
jgi:hypothetical protein